MDKNQIARFGHIEKCSGGAGGRRRTLWHIDRNPVTHQCTRVEIIVDILGQICLYVGIAQAQAKYAHSLAIR